MITRNRVSAAAAALLVSALPLLSANATPRKYSNCAVKSQIKSPANSSGFYLSEDCKTAYVLPPATGAIGLSSYVDEIGAKAELCSAVNGTMREMAERKGRGLRELERIESRNRAIARQQTENKSICLEIEAYAESSEAKLRTNQQAQSDQKAKLDRLDSELGKCAGEACDRLRMDRELAADKLESLKLSEERLQGSSTRYAAKKDACHAQRDRSDQAIEAELTQNQVRTAEVKSLLAAMTQQTNSLFESQRSEPGAQMSIVISSEQTQLTKQFRELNTGMNVQFMEMPLNDVNLSFTQINDGVASGYPTLLKALINGMPVGADSSLNRVPFGPGSANQEIVFGAAVGGSLTINRFAACQLPSSDDYGNSSASRLRQIKDIAGLFSGTATYRYQLGVSRKIRIRYNEKQLYCLIKKHSSSSGLFRSSSSTSVNESSQASQWLSIAVESEDSGFDFANRETLLMDLRSEMLDRALMKVATSYLSRERASLVEPETPRADGMAGEIRKCPHLYCQAAALVLNLGSALFGGTSSSSSTCEDVGASSEQDYVDTKPVSAFGTQAFTVRATGAR
jgi:hypothetical protein